MLQFIPQSSYKTGHYFKLILISVFSMCLSRGAEAQITITGGQTAVALAQKLAGGGVVITNPVLTCAPAAYGIFNAVTPANIGIDSGIILTTGIAASGPSIGANGLSTSFASTDNNYPGDAYLNTYIGNTTHDACALEFDFKPAGDTIKFNYAFASEEYTSFSCSSFNDVFGFFITGPNITGTQNLALIPNTTVPVAVNSTTDTNITHPANTTLCRSMGFGSPFGMYYAGSRVGSTYDGFTKILTAIQKVLPCSTYHLKLIIADVQDGILDSGVWLEAGSLKSNTAKINSSGLHSSSTVPYCVRGCYPGTFAINRSDTNAKGSPLTVHFVIGGTAVNGTDYSLIPDSITIPVGQARNNVVINALAVTPPTGVKNVKIYVLAPSCNPLAPPVILDSATIDIYDKLNVKIISPDTAICFGDAVNVTAIGDTLFSYSWSPSAGAGVISFLGTNISTILKPDSTTTYTLKASLTVCPDILNDIKIEVQPIPKVNAGNDTVICQWDVVHLHADVKPSWFTNYSYTWAPTTDLDLPKSANIIQRGNNNAKLSITVTTPIGCTGSDTINVNIHPGHYATGPKEVNVCPNDSASIVVATSGRGVKFEWLPAAFLSSTKDSLVKTAPSGPLVYTVYVTDIWGCRDTVSAPVYTHPGGVLYLGDNIHLYPGEKFQMHAQGNCTSYQWFPYVGLSATNIADPVIDPTVNTRYFVAGLTTDGCKVYDTIDVYMDRTVMDVPNAFTPLGMNNELKIVKRGIATLKYFRIFNRWGEKVFESTDANKGWDGRYNNIDQPMGVYIYTIEADMIDGRHFSKQGNVTLIR